MAFNLPPPPVGNDVSGPAFRDWFYKLVNYLAKALDLSFVTGVLDEANGGTGQDSYAIGDTLYASGTTTLSKLPIGATGDTVLVSGGIPSWSSFQTNVNANTNLRNLLSTSLLTDAALIINADPTKFNIPAFSARYVDNYTDPLNPVYTMLSYAGSTGNTVPDIAIQDATFISLDKNGTIYQSASQLTPAQSRDRVEIGALIHTNRTSIASITEFTETVSIDTAASINDFSLSLGPINRSGNVFSGNSSSTLKINKSAGETFQVGLNWGVSKQSPNVTTDAPLNAPSFFYSWRNGSGNFNVVITDTVNPGRFDDGTGGATQPNGVVNVNKWQLIKIYRQQAANANGVALEYGQVEYANLAAAIAAKAVDTIVNPAIATLQFRGWLAVRGGATDLTNASDAQFINAGAFSSPVNAGGVGSSTTTTLQSAYNNSVTPQITTSTALGSVDIKRGSAADTDNVFRTLNGAGTATATITGAGTLTALNFSGSSSGTNTGNQNLFSTIAVSGQSNVVADSTTDTLTLVAGANVTITTNAATDEITIASTASGGGGSVTSVTSANADLSVANTTTTPVITMVQTPALRSATTTVGVSAAAAPSIGQVLTATSSTAATWQTPSIKAENVLTADLTISADTSYVVAGYFNPSTFSLTLNGNLAII